MALTVGTDAYISLADANTYWLNRDNATWAAASDADKEAAIREATQYLDGAYNWIGDHPGGSSQLLGWPRNNAVISSGNRRGVYLTGIPQAVEDACAELALEALSGRLRPAADHGGAIKREKVDIIETEYQDGAPTHKTYDFVTMLLKGLTRGGKSTAKLIRS